MKKEVSLFAIMILFAASIVHAQYNNTSSRFIDSDGYISLEIENSTIENVQKSASLFQQKSLSLLWEDDEDVSNHQDVDSWNPRIAVENNGTAHIVFNDNQNQLQYAQKIMYTKKEVGGTWTTPLIIDENTAFGSRNNHVPAVAVSPNGDVHVAFLTWAYENWRHEMAYTRYDAVTQIWSQAIVISEAGGSIESFEHIEIYSTEDNRPVIVWGFDNRTSVEEVYMSYFDGANWSGDILVSTADEDEQARFPRIERIDNTRAMILFWEETFETDVLVIKYRIFDESDNSLSTISPIPQTLHHTENLNFPDFNFDLSNKNDGHAILSLWEYEYPVSGAMSDTIKCLNYNIANDSFEMSPFKLIGGSSGLFPKYITVSCDYEGNTGIVFMDTYVEEIAFVEFDPITGFSTPEIIVSEDLIGGDLPDSKFDNEGNFHLTWDDLRFDAPGGYVEREVFYKKGVGATSYSITFIVTDLNTSLPIPEATVNLQGVSENTNDEGIVIFDGYFPGTYSWVVSKTDYETQTGELMVVDSDVTVDVSLDFISAIADYQLSKTHVYPNPASDIIHIDSDLNLISVKVYSIYGQAILDYQVSGNKYLLNMAQYESGIYLFLIETEKGTLTERIVIK